MIKVFFSILCLSFFIFLGIKRTDNFRVTKIIKTSSNNSGILQKPSDEIHDILSQEFSYLTRGRQCFVFESRDKKYVLKLINSFNHNLASFLQKTPCIPLLETYRKKQFLKRQNKSLSEISSYKLAYRELKDQSALVYLHLNKTDFFNEKIKIKSKYGSCHFLDLDSYVFLLQKKAQNFYEELEQAQGDLFDSLLLSFIDMIADRSNKNIIDDDIGKRRRNWGVIDNRVVTIDIGKFYFDEKLMKYSHVYRKEMNKACKTLLKFLNEKYPEKTGYFLQKLDEKIKSQNKK